MRMISSMSGPLWTLEHEISVETFRANGNAFFVLHQFAIDNWVAETEGGCGKFTRYASVDIFIVVVRVTTGSDI